MEEAVRTRLGKGVPWSEDNGKPTCAWCGECEECECECESAVCVCVSVRVGRRLQTLKLNEHLVLELVGLCLPNK